MRARCQYKNHEEEAECMFEMLLGVARIVADVVLITLLVMDLKDKFKRK